MNLWNETKSVPISPQMIWTAYKKMRANKGSAGVDSVSMEEFDVDRSKHLYKLWNRMASGSYFPPPVKEVEISKEDGKVRKPGNPTISDLVKWARKRYKRYRTNLTKAVRWLDRVQKQYPITYSYIATLVRMQASQIDVKVEICSFEKK